MITGMLKGHFKNIALKGEFYKMMRLIRKRKRHSRLKCLQINQLHHFLEGPVYHLTDNFLYCPVEFGKTVHPMILSVVHICLEKTIAPYLHFLF